MLAPKERLSHQTWRAEPPAQHFPGYKTRPRANNSARPLPSLSAEISPHSDRRLKIHTFALPNQPPFRRIAAVGVQKAVDSIANGGTLRPDGFPIVMLQRRPSVIPYLTNLSDCIAASGRIPTTILEASVSPSAEPRKGPFLSPIEKTNFSSNHYCRISRSDDTEQDSARPWTQSSPRQISQSRSAGNRDAPHCGV